MSDTPLTDATLSMAAAARYLGVNKQTVRRAIKRGELYAAESNEPGGGYLISPSDLDRWLKQNGARLERHRPQQLPLESTVNQTVTRPTPGTDTHSVDPSVSPSVNRLVAEMAAEEHRLAARLDAVTDNLRETEAANAELRQQNAVFEERDRSARAVMLEARDLMQIQGQRIDDLKTDKARLDTDKARLDTDKAAMATLLGQAHDRLLAVDAERRQLLDRLLAVVDLNLPPQPTTDATRRRDRH